MSECVQHLSKDRTVEIVWMGTVLLEQIRHVVRDLGAECRVVSLSLSEAQSVWYSRSQVQASEPFGNSHSNHLSKLPFAIGDVVPMNDFPTHFGIEKQATTIRGVKSSVMNKMRPVIAGNDFKRLRTTTTRR